MGEQTDTADLVKCGKCGFPIHPSETGVRHFGFFVAHSEERCTSLLQAALSSTQARADKLEAELASAQQSNENWMNRCLTAETKAESHRQAHESLAVANRRLSDELVEAKRQRDWLASEKEQAIRLKEAAESSLAAANERVKELEEALKPFAAKADLYEANHPTSRHPLRNATQITHRLGDFRAARTALKTAARKE